jgi:hypothetical protein
LAKVSRGKDRVDWGAVEAMELLWGLNRANVLVKLRAFAFDAAKIGLLPTANEPMRKLDRRG